MWLRMAIHVKWLKKIRDAYIPRINVFTKFPKANKQLAEESRALLSQMESEGYIIYCGHHDYENLVK